MGTWGGDEWMERKFREQQAQRLSPAVSEVTELGKRAFYDGAPKETVDTTLAMLTTDHQRAFVSGYLRVEIQKDEDPLEALRRNRAFHQRCEQEEQKARRPSYLRLVK